MKKSVVAMVLVGGRGTRLKNITKNTAKPAVLFGGKYKLIDFVLSNLSNSHIDTCGIVTQYEPLELMNHIGLGSTWDLDVNNGGISFLTPYTSMSGEKWQKGTAHAIEQHFKYIEQYDPDYVLILGGDHIYKMNYNNLIKAHKSNNAELTIGTFTVESHPERYGILTVDDKSKIIGFEEKPNNPKSKLASMGIYLFNTKTLKDLLNKHKDGDVDFGNDIIPLAIKQEKNIFAYIFDGYFRDVGTVESLYKANMELIDNPQNLKLREYKDLPIFSRSSNLPPHHISAKANVTNSIISDGSLIIGTVYHSVISSGVVIEYKAEVTDSIIHENVKIKEGCTINNCIVMKGTVLLPNTTLDFDEPTIVDNEFLWKLGDRDE
ncbi:MAG: NTP transferase domain-containing protein [Candidatus Izimaplasma sp.]|nr:NTP transferase domain-containing protein [Candidatus Izimaplasma bacterium]